MLPLSSAEIEEEEVEEEGEVNSVFTSCVGNNDAADLLMLNIDCE